MPVGDGALHVSSGRWWADTCSMDLSDRQDFWRRVIAELGTQTSEPSVRANVWPTAVAIHTDMLQRSANVEGNYARLANLAWATGHANLPMCI